MSELAKQIDDTVHRIILKAEHQLELLAGPCAHPHDVTNTQEHILMLIAHGQSNNADLARTLNISQAATSKAIKDLKHRGLLTATKDAHDKRVSHYQLTALAEPIAAHHAQHHRSTLSVYAKLVSRYTAAEQATIQHFLTELQHTIEEMT